jgi:OOP family OmpA-OmpF porin
VDPLPAVAPVGVFPPLGTLAPITSCGTTITLSDGVLFDFDRSEIRADATGVLDELAAAMTELDVPTAEIGGHTDAIGSDGYNQELSERRAASVVAALVDRGVTASLSAVGYGESAPVAANEIDGVDNPAGRQLNRRVEIFIPAF